MNYDDLLRQAREWLKREHHQLYLDREIERAIQTAQQAMNRYIRNQKIIDDLKRLSGASE